MADMVMPERDVPGLSDNTCAAPISSAWRVVSCSATRSPLRRSAHHNTAPNPMSDTAITTGPPSCSAITSSKNTPTTAAGTAVSTYNHASRPCGSVARVATEANGYRTPETTSDTRSLRTATTTANSVPRCNAASNAVLTDSLSRSFQSNNHGTSCK